MRLLSRRLSDKKRYFTEEMVRKEQMQCEDEEKKYGMKKLICMGF